MDAFHTKLSLTVGTELTTQVKLRYELRGGHDYTLLRAAEGDGLLWAPVERPPSLPSVNPGPEYGYRSAPRNTLVASAKRQ